MEEIPNSTDGQGALLGLPETQTELDVYYILFKIKYFSHH